MIIMRDGLANTAQHKELAERQEGRVPFHLTVLANL